MYQYPPSDEEHIYTETIVNTLNDKQDKLTSLDNDELIDNILMSPFNPPTNLDNSSSPKIGGNQQMTQYFIGGVPCDLSISLNN